MLSDNEIYKMGFKDGVTAVCVYLLLSMIVIALIGVFLK